MKGICKFLFVTILAFMSGCKHDDEVGGEYFITLDNIETEQFHSTYGRGGIYWVTDSYLILNAQVENENDVKERGVYLVGIDGSAIRIVDSDVLGRYHFCFDGDVLYIRADNAEVDIINGSKDYSVEISGFVKNGESEVYSEVDCKYYKKPEGLFRVKPLSKKDGFIVNVSDEKEGGVKSFVVKGENRNSLNLGGEPLRSPARYLKFSNEYFFYDFLFWKRGCGRFSWISNVSWGVREERYCFNEWLESTSKLASATRYGVFVEQHTDKYHTGILINNLGVYKIEKKSINKSVVSPNGCFVAYGFGNYRSKRGRDDYRQVLKIFNVCKFMEESAGAR